jgi:hypothetical protein
MKPKSANSMPKKLQPLYIGTMQGKRSNTRDIVITDLLLCSIHAMHQNEEWVMQDWGV